MTIALADARADTRAAAALRRASALLVACSLAVLVVAGCGRTSSKPPRALAGLDAVPASAQVVVAVDVARVASSPLVERAVETLLLEDADLAARWHTLQDRCKLDLASISTVLLAIGPSAGPAPGTGPVILVATGRLVESELAACVRAMVGQGGGALTARSLEGRTLYQAKDGNRTMFFAFGRADTVVLGSNEAYVVEALGAGKKAQDNPELARWMSLADRQAPVWAAGRVDGRVSGGLVKVTGGSLKAGPSAMVVSVDPSRGARLDVGAVMASVEDAKALESFAKAQLSLMALAAQSRGLGKLVDKVTVSGDSTVVRFKADLGMEDVNQLISALDGGGLPAQDSSPPPGPGSAAGPQR